jgi:hypothetical protein
MGMGSKKVSSGQGVTEVWYKEGGKHKIKGEDGFNTVSHVEGGVASGFTSGGMVCTKNKRHEGWPLGVVTCTCFDEGFMDGMVLVFDDAISSGVIGGYADMMNSILASQPVQHGDVSSSIVSNDLLDSSLPA